MLLKWALYVWVRSVEMLAIGKIEVLVKQEIVNSFNIFRNNKTEAMKIRLFWTMLIFVQIPF